MLTMRWLGLSAAYYCNQSYQHMHAHIVSAKGCGQNAVISKKLNMKWWFSEAEHPVQAVFWKLKKLKIPFPQYFCICIFLLCDVYITELDFFKKYFLKSRHFQSYEIVFWSLFTLNLECICMFVFMLLNPLKTLSKISQKTLKEFLQNLIGCGPE